jgi:hypothetical protein
MIFPKVGQQEQRRVVIEGFLNVDWLGSIPEHYHPPSCPCGCTTDADFDAFVADALVPSMAQSLVRLFPRHRWVRAEETINDIAILTAPHRMLQRVLPVWLKCLRDRRQPAPRDFRQQAEADSDLLNRGWSESEEELLAPGDDVDDDGPQQQQQQQQEAPPANSAEDWHAFNERMRATASALAVADPTPQLVVLRMVTEPAREMMQEMLTLSGTGWDHQRAADHAVGIGPRRYPITEVGKSPTKYLAKMRSLLCEDAWREFPHQWSHELLPLLSVDQIAIFGWT